MKIYLTALFALAVLASPNDSSATKTVTLKHEIKSKKFSQVYLGSVSRSDGTIYLWTDGISNVITNAEFVSSQGTYTLVSISGAFKGSGNIVKGQFTFEDANGQDKLIVLNNAHYN